MTYAEMNGPLVSGRAHAVMDSIYSLLGQVGVAGQTKAQQFVDPTDLSELEQSLTLAQETISKVSMHLPSGFANGLNRQFANLMEEDAWEDEDEFIGEGALAAFIQMLIKTKAQKRPGIGTNGRGSITASWTIGKNRLTIECLPSQRASVVLSRLRETGELERAAFNSLHPSRVREVIEPFSPEVWFDG